MQISDFLKRYENPETSPDKKRQIFRIIATKLSSSLICPEMHQEAVSFYKTFANEDFSVNYAALQDGARDIVPLFVGYVCSAPLLLGACQDLRAQVLTHVIPVMLLQNSMDIKQRNRLFDAVVHQTQGYDSFMGATAPCQIQEAAFQHVFPLLFKQFPDRRRELMDRIEGPLTHNLFLRETILEKVMPEFVRLADDDQRKALWDILTEKTIDSRTEPFRFKAKEASMRPTLEAFDQYEPYKEGVAEMRTRLDAWKCARQRAKEANGQQY